MKVDVAIIGGGAAGLFCAMTAARRGRRVVVFEHNSEVGRKIVISGGGRCNFTNRIVKAENFISRNPHFCKSALAGYTPDDFIGLVKKHKIDFYEKKLGQLFCRNSSKDIVKMLLDECADAGVKILTAVEVRNVERGELFEIDTSAGNFSAEKLVIATGGLSFPKVGATGFGYDIARKFGMKIVETRASLVPLVFLGDQFTKLAGLSVDSDVVSAKHSFRENILFTHRGLSGPAILQISNYWSHEKEIAIDLLPDVDISAEFSRNRDSKQLLDNFLSRFLPSRFAEEFTARNFTNKPIAQMNEKQINDVVDLLKSWKVKFGGTEGYDKAEVTIGGVDTDELSSKTMESKKVSGLYFIGEVVDVTGWLGGYNFQWAWASGFAAGQEV